MEKIDYLPLRRITERHGEAIQEAVREVVGSGWYLQGEATAAFEREYADFIGARHCVSCANGLDALTLIFRAYREMGVLQAGDEVLVPANTYIASILALTENGLRPMLVEPHPDTFQLDETRLAEHLTPRTRAVLLVHLYGRNAYTDSLGAFCRERGLLLVEDNAQAHGCRHRDGRRTGALGDAAGHSFYPGKNLGALGDAGAVTTDDERLATLVRALANYGSSRKYVFPYIGRNSRMDEVQAAVLRVKLPFVDADNARRKEIAATYCREVHHPDFRLPEEDATDNVFHIFPLLTPRRDELQQYLTERGVGTMIHYPIPPHRQACYPEWNALSLPITERIHAEELSLPCHPAMTDGEVALVVKTLNEF